MMSASSEGPPMEPAPVVDADAAVAADDVARCPICLDPFADRTVLNVCFHAFCFACIRQWARVSRSCPLCKQDYRFMIHNIRSDTEFERYEPPPAPLAAEQDGRGGRHRRRRTPYAFPLEAAEDNVRAGSPEALERRRTVYRLGLRAKHVGSNRFSRYRELSPELFRNHPESLERVEPWLDRELHVLLGTDEDVELVKEFVMSLMRTYDLQSTAALNELKPFFFERTEQFVHELVAFCRSPFSMGVYDRYVQYGHDDVTNDVVAPTPSASAASTASAATLGLIASASSLAQAASTPVVVAAASSPRARPEPAATRPEPAATRPEPPATRPEPAATPMAVVRSGVSAPSPTASLLAVGAAPTAAPSRTAMSGMRQRLLERIVEERRVAEKARLSNSKKV